MRSTIKGEVRVLAPTRNNDRYVDVAILPEGAANSVRAWAFADAEGLGAVKVGDVIEADCYTTAKLPKAVVDGERPANKSDAYLSTQLRSARIVSVAGDSKLHKVS